MTTTLASMMTKIMPFVCERVHDPNAPLLKDLLILTDIALCTIDVDSSDEAGVARYVKTMKTMNDLYTTFEIVELEVWITHEDGVVFDNAKVDLLEQYPTAVAKFQQRRMNIWQDMFPELIEQVRPQEDEILLEDLPM